jgi:hypothetical protein
MTSEEDSAWNLVPVGWPQYFMFHSSINQVGTMRASWYDPLHARGMPFYPTLQAAVAELIYGVPSNQIPSTMSAHVLVRLPDLRARIRPASFGDGVVRASVEEGKPDGARRCTLRAAWRANSTSETWRHLDLPIAKAGGLEIETGDIPAEMWMILTGPDGQMLDRYGWSDTSVLQPEQTGDLSARVERWIQEGEGLQVEFKQQLGEKQVNRSFAETVAAFANGSGGVVLVGVADDRTIIGWDPPDAFDQITTIVRALVKEYVAVQVDRVTVEDKPVQIVIVPAGAAAEKPYRCDDVIMVRANATTGKATTWEIQRLAREAQA